MSYEVLSTNGVLVAGKGADDLVVMAMQASGWLHPKHGATRHEDNPAQVIYFPAPGVTSEQVIEALERVIESVLPTTLRLPANI